MIFADKREDFVKQADMARDQKMWLRAAELYDKHLAESPEDASILVQAGNCYKDARRFDEAAARYEKALALTPFDSDLHVQRGHLLKLQGRQGEAIESYRCALKHDSKNSDALDELLAAGVTDGLFEQGSFEGSQRTKTIWLDVTDIMEYAQHNKSLSGIQRVVANLILFGENGEFEGYRICPVIPEYDRHRILAASNAALVHLIRQFDRSNFDRQIADSSIATVFASRYEVYPEKGDIFLVAGAFWIYPHYDVIRELRKIGMRFGVFIHDLIQIKNPQYVQQAAVDKFQRQLIDVFSVSDFVLCNSEFVANEIREYFRDHLNYKLPVRPIVLATELRKAERGRAIANRAIIQMAHEEYVLCVATIEVRKNHLFLVRIWEKLIREFGQKAPKLVFVGKWGWQIDHLRDYLAQKGYVGDWLFIFNDITDEELEFLYRHSLFTAYPSFAEGFGLPIGESLGYGKPCIVSNTTSMPEVGGRFPRYIDPYNVEGSYEIFRKPIADRADLMAWEEDIRANFSPKTWSKFTTEFFSAAIEMATSLADAAPTLNCLLPKGVIIEGGDDALLRLGRENKRVITFRAARDSGWHAMESWGVWSAQRRARLVFDSDFQEDSPIRIYLEVRCPPESRNTTVIASAGGGEFELPISDIQNFISFSGIAEGNGRVTIKLLARGEFANPDGRGLHVALTKIAYCSDTDSLERINLLEKIAFQPQSKGFP